MVSKLVINFLLLLLLTTTNLIKAEESQQFEKSKEVIETSESDSNLESISTGSVEDNSQEISTQEVDAKENMLSKIIDNIVVVGNKLVSNNAILSRVPFRSGIYFDPSKTSFAIHNLYNMGYFSNIIIEIDNISDDKLDIIITVVEKRKLESVCFEGLSALKSEEVETKLKFKNLPTIDLEEAQLYGEKIKKLYAEKGYHNVSVEAVLTYSSEGNLVLTYKIIEGSKTVIKKVNFIGNNSFPSKKLRSIIFTREDWLLSFLDKAGTYQPDMLEQDKQMIEYFYQSNGFLTAHIVDTEIIRDENQNMTVTFTIDEGELYTIKSVAAKGNHLLSEADLLAGIPVKPGQLYNRDLLRNTLEILRATWGRYGYIYAHVEPSVIPDMITKTVEVSFNTDLDQQIFLNRINIIGNKKTRDYIIRRAITLNEGELLTTQSMDMSKARVESLGFFDPKSGANWNINKIDDKTADLDLILKEIKTGRFFWQVGFGANQANNPINSMQISGGIIDKNFLGTGLSYNLNLSFAKEQRSAQFGIFQPWLFNRPIGGGFDAYYTKSVYDEFKNASTVPVENLAGGVAKLTFAPQRFPDLSTVAEFGIENIRFESRVTAENLQGQEQRLMQELLNRRFQEGTITSLGVHFGQDLRNHPVLPTAGYNWTCNSKLAFPVKSNYSYFKIDLDATWVNPLIGDQDLVFLLHGHFGYVKPFGNKIAPYRELYHVGGLGSVRGFTYGQIGPMIYGDSIGAKKAFWVNAEVVFSALEDRSIRLVAFYDGGAAWDTPNAEAFSGLPLQNNLFNYRHAIGFGLRLTYPTPFRVDFGFKLDRNKKLGESPYEVHFTGAQEF